jgi:hypothetical protein
VVSVRAPKSAPYVLNLSITATHECYANGKRQTDRPRTVGPLFSLTQSVRRANKACTNTTFFDVLSELASASRKDSIMEIEGRLHSVIRAIGVDYIKPAI